MANTKTAKKEKEESPKRNTQIARATDYGIIYSDTTRISVSPYDVKITFSVNETLPNNDVQLTEMVTVALSPLHAKAFVEILAKNVEYYERDVMQLNLNEKHNVEFQEAIKILASNKK